MWLDNLSDQGMARRLKKLRAKLNINFNYVARANVWQNFRNPLAMMTLFRTDISEKNLDGDFIRANSWGNSRGLYKYAFIPDGSSEHEVASYSSYRETLLDYLGGD